jgi:hypothetical protein
MRSIHDELTALGGLAAAIGHPELDWKDAHSADGSRIGWKGTCVRCGVAWTAFSDENTGPDIPWIRCTG